ncbi:hypothetical protein OIV83_004383 [Microbotryomycetes sp. JL201]|nr:hypothetical protein OIV83_004383 [Microbotryomycetes sp. JL201]
MSAVSSERTPLLQNQQASAAASQEDAAAYAAASESAIQSAFHGDVNASAFQVPAVAQVAEDEETLPAATAPLVTEPPMRSDLFLVLGGMWVGTFLAALDGTIVATILSTSFQPLYGRFSDIFGRKSATLFASAIFMLGSLACGLSRTFPQLIAARAFAGIGGGGLTTMSSIVTSDLIPLRKRGVYQGLGNVVYAGGAAIGGPLGGWLGDTIGWRVAFLIQVPLCVVHFAIVAWKVDIPAGGGDFMSKIKRIDFLGSFTMVASVALLLVGLSLGGNEREWADPLVWGTIIGGVAGIIIFVLIEKYVAREPLLSPKILFSRTPGFVSLTNWFITMSQFAIIYSIPLYFAAVKQYSTSYSGTFLIPNAVFASTASLLAGLYMARTGVYRTLLISVGFLGWVGPLAMILWNRKVTPEWAYWLSMIPAGIGYGGTFAISRILTITLVALIAAVEPAQMASATGVSYLFRATGSVLGISLSTSILQNSLKSQLHKRIVGKGSRKIIENIRLDVNYIKTLPHHLQIAAIDSYEHAMHVVFIATFVAALAAFVCLLMIPQLGLPGRLDRK